jgi:hypothetical protein
LINVLVGQPIRIRLRPEVGPALKAFMPHIAQRNHQPELRQLLRPQFAQPHGDLAIGREFVTRVAQHAYPAHQQVGLDSRRRDEARAHPAPEVGDEGRPVERAQR